MTVEEQMISIVKSVINNETPRIVVTDWDKLIQLADHHCMTIFVAYAANDSTPDYIKKRIQSAVTLSVVRMAKYEHETKTIISEFEKNRIAYMPLKGYIAKKLYPIPEMRTMADVDMLIMVKDIEKVEQIMLSLGYVNANLELDDEITYNKLPFCSFEMHTQMVSSSHAIIHSYYGDGWNFAQKDENNGFGYHMSKEDFFIFMLAHFTKHYASSGIGLRAVVDIYLYLKNYREMLDWEYIDKELDKLRCREFVYNIFDLADFWFGNSEGTPKAKIIANFLFKCGTYGSSINRITVNEMRADNRLVYSIKRILDAVFLKHDTMCEIYPKLIRHPWLIWFYWFKRLVTKCFSTSGRKFCKIHIKASARVNKTREHFKEIGLNNFLNG